MKKILFLLLLIAGVTVASAQQSCPKWGPYVHALHTPGNAKLMMADVMIPENGMAPFTYACPVQFGIGKSGSYHGI